MKERQKQTKVAMKHESGNVDCKRDIGGFFTVTVKKPYKQQRDVLS